MKKYVLFMMVALMAGFAVSANAAYESYSYYPTIWVHGMGGWSTDSAAWPYWGGSIGVPPAKIYDVCNGGLEYWPACNDYLDYSWNQYAGPGQTSWQTSDYRGSELYNNIINFFYSRGFRDYDNDYDHLPAWKANYVNLIGHSQGGIDLRKAGKMIKNNAPQIPYSHRWDESWCYTNGVWPADWQDCRTSQNYATWYVTLKPGVMMSISSPHRGSPTATAVRAHSSYTAFVAEFLETIYEICGISPSGGDAVLGINFLDASYGLMGTFNSTYPKVVGSPHVSIITMQEGGDQTPVLWALNAIAQCGNISGSVAGVYTSCSGTNSDDDGLVGINSQQMGKRVNYNSSLSDRTDCGDIEPGANPSCLDLSGVLNQDHLDIACVPPDNFDEMEMAKFMLNKIKALGY